MARELESTPHIPSLPLMATLYPLTTYACPCSGLTSAPLPTTNRRASFQPSTIQLSEDQALNPHSSRANYALYPLEHLLYCDECDAVRCPRCWTEEVLYWYCPMCLFEVPSSAVRGDGNRCARSCYSCPDCSSQLSVTQIESHKDKVDLLKPGDASGTAENESYILQCQHCEWNSLSVDMQFSKPTKITEQIAKLRKSRMSSNKEDEAGSHLQPPRHDELFANLSAFYKEQLNETTDSQNPYSSSPYSSPANLARIMSLYGGLPYNALKKSREKPQPMREALQHSEGLVAYNIDDTSDATIVQQMQDLGWEGTTFSEQKHSTPVNNNAKFTDDLYPAAMPLRTRRGRRCKTCRQFLTRPETKVGSMKYRIRLLAINYIPRLSLRILEPGPPPGNPAFHLKAQPLEQQPLHPHEMKSYILTVRNPLFEPVRISLATPATTPGKVASKVTILCPSFTVGPAGEIWDEALNSSTPTAADGGRSAAMASLTGSAEQASNRKSSDGRLGPSAGKVWDRTRNSSSVVIEIVPGALETGPGIVPINSESEAEELGDDDEILEIPVYVRAEWEVEVRAGDTLPGRKAEGRELGEKIPKELGYWVVLSVGQIQSSSP